MKREYIKTTFPITMEFVENKPVVMINKRNEKYNIYDLSGKDVSWIEFLEIVKNRLDFFTILEKYKCVRLEEPLQAVGK